MKIGLDIMGGDFAPRATIGGAIQAHKELPSDTIVLFGDKIIIEKELKEHNADSSYFEIIHAPDVILMGESPTKALNQKPNSSIALGFHYLKNNKIDSFASAGNTGAMLVGSMYSIQQIEGILRPCTTAMLPKENGSVGILLDVGTNPDAKPEVLYQFAVLGSIYAEYVYNIKEPKVGLLNIGEEKEKGNLLCQSTYKLMKETKDFNFIGNIESRDIFKDKADVIVCDGFTGNVILKLAEGFYRMMQKHNLIDDYFKRFNYENYGGTAILGVNSTVIVGHGISNETAIKNMLKLSKEVFEAKLAAKIKNAFNYV
ncbi:MAG: phosphate acyltransferase PlsX [Bacteroidales bacterium]|jgi:glycerol-3-phosphate acyltransferase PlsX